jgi:DNA polymerase
VRTLGIDIETFSDEDLGAVGVHRYAASPGFRVLLFGYSADGSPAEVCDLANGEPLPREVARALDDPQVVKRAFNAQFERVCLSEHLRRGRPFDGYLDPAQWRCTMAQAAYWGASGGLRQAGACLGTDVQKDAAGTRLMNRFSRPQPAPVPREGEDWERFVAYCRTDVECETAIAAALPGPLPEREQRLYVLDQRVNDAGVRVDRALARCAVRMAEDNDERLQARLRAVTGLANPNSVAQLKGWLDAQGACMPSLNREAVEAALAGGGELSDAVREALSLRLAGAKATNKKYAVAARAAGEDGRLRGSFQFYGASTGRWAGRLVQLQNLARGDLQGRDRDMARELVRAGDADGVRMLYGDVAETLKSLVRTVLVPARGAALVVSDFASVEARVLAWLAGEEWALDVFRTTGRVYEATAARMFRVAEGEVTKELRQRGKVATLALGYQGGPAALERMGALRAGVDKRDLPRLVRMWRLANPGIVRLWAETEDAVRAVAAREAGRLAVAKGRIEVSGAGFGVLVRLPSGRALAYRGMRADPCDGRLSYVAAGSRTETYGGRLVENVTQAVARDLLAEAMLELHGDGRRIVAHVHDEVVMEADEAEAASVLGAARAAMSRAPEWAPGLPLSAEGYVCDYYRKG